MIPEPISTSSSATGAIQRPARPRRVSSLRGDPRGDTGASSIATSDLARQSDQLSPPTSPVLKSANEKSGRTQSKRKKAKSLFSRWKRMSLKHTWVNPLVIVLAILGAYYINPGEQNPLHAGQLKSKCKRKCKCVNAPSAHLGRIEIRSLRPHSEVVWTAYDHIPKAVSMRIGTRPY